jgi:RNA polymerase sigma factor (sigma-70 family)
MSDQAFNLEDFRLHPDPYLQNWYRSYRTPFIRWAKSRNSRISDDTVADIFQDAAIIFWKNVQSGHLVELTASPKTYLFSIGRNLLRAQARHVVPEELPDNAALPADLLGLDYGVENEMIKAEENARLYKALEDLGDPCKTLLRLTYFEGMSSAEIMPILNYASEEVVRTRRKKCMERIRVFFKPK